MTTPQTTFPTTCSCLAEPGSKRDEFLNQLSFGGLIVQFIFAATVMAPLTFAPGRARIIWLLSVFLLPWLPQFLRCEFWRSLRRPQWLGADYALAVFFIASGYACVTSVLPLVSLKFILTLGLTGLSTYALCRYTLNSLARIKWFAAIWCGVGFCLAIFGGVEWLGQKYYALDWLNFQATYPVVDIHAGRVNQVVLFYLNPIPAAATFLLLFAGAGVLLVGRKMWGRVLFLAMFLLTFSAIWLTHSRGGVLAVGAAFFVYLLIRKWRLAIVLVVCSVVVGWGTYAYWPPKMQRLVKEGVRDKNIRIRLENYHFASQLVRGKVWQGIGPRVAAADTAGRIFAPALASYQPVFFKGKAERAYYIGVLTRNRTLDNSLLTIGVEHGLIAACALFVFVICLLRLGLQSARSTSRTSCAGLAAVLTIVLLAFFLQGLEHDVHPWLHLNALGGLAAGMLASLSRVGDGSGESQEDFGD